MFPTKTTAKGFVPERAFFALWAKQAGGEPVTRCLEGPLPVDQYEGASGAIAPNHSLPRFREASFAAAYPFGQVLLSDRDVPVDVRIEAFNPLVPGDADKSSMPVAVLRFVLTNRTSRAVQASVCASLSNFIGHDGSDGKPRANENVLKTTKPVRGLFMQSNGVNPKAHQFGTMALATTSRTGVTCRKAWAEGRWREGLLGFWDDFSANGRLTDVKMEHGDAPTGSVAVRATVPPRGEKAVTFILAWHFPNRATWQFPPSASDCCPDGSCDTSIVGIDQWVGNYYAKQFKDAWAAAQQCAAALPRLERDTATFVRSVCDSDLPDVVKEAALYNVSDLRTQTTFRIASGHLMGWEGCHDRSGCCNGTCTHVWNYEQATAFLFGDLAKTMRDVEFVHCTDERGLMSFRAQLPLRRAQDFHLAAADGQMGCLMKLYRDWRLSGDDAFLKKMWPAARRALEFCWVDGGWDADRDGVMEGCQHNTMDVEYFGPNPQMTGWYLGALRAMEQMARYLGEDDFADDCHALFERGSAWMDEHLFNGEYYEHHVQPPKKGQAIADGLRVGMGATELGDPAFQLGAGCLVDQLVGQYFAHVVGLGYLHKRSHVRKTLRSIDRYNFRASLQGHFNHMRSYALGEDEAALLMASYPHGERPKLPFPYFNEVMTGFEYTAAVGMLYEGQTSAGLRCIGAIRARYDGKKRSPFNEAECGHHYARSMASWAAVLALTGFQYDATAGAMTFAAARKSATWFWSNGYAWGTVRQTPSRQGVTVKLTVLHGSLKLRELTIAGTGTKRFTKPRSITAGRSATVRV